MKTLIIAHHSAIYREALSQYLSTALSGIKLVTVDRWMPHKNCSADIIFSSLALLSSMSGEQYRDFWRAYPGIPIVVLFDKACAPDVTRFKSKCHAIAAFLSQETPGKIIALMAEAYLSRGQIADPAGLLQKYVATEKRGCFSVLTNREQEVLRWLARGKSNKDIAAALGIQVVTIKMHVRGICRKLQVKNRTQAALMAQEKGLVSA